MLLCVGLVAQPIMYQPGPAVACRQPLLEAEAQGNSNGTAFAFTMTYNNQDVLQLQSDPNAGDSLVSLHSFRAGLG